MIFDGNKFSQRINRILNNPENLKAHLNTDFELTFDSADKILTAHHKYHPDSEALKAIMAETFCFISKGKGRRDLWPFSFREFESFLRDENHLPAFKLEISEVESDFKRMKMHFLGFVYSGILLHLREDLLMWKEMNLVKKNQLALDLCKILDWELVFAEEESIHIISPFPIGSGLDYHVFLEAALGESYKASSIKLVAVVE